MKHYRYYISDLKQLYIHLCQTDSYALNEKSCCTTKVSKVDCPKCTRILKQGIHFVELKTKRRKAKK